MNSSKIRCGYIFEDYPNIFLLPISCLINIQKLNDNFQIHKQIIFISSLFILYLLLSSNPFVYVENSSEIV